MFVPKNKDHFECFACLCIIIKYPQFIICIIQCYSRLIHFKFSHVPRQSPFFLFITCVGVFNFLFLYTASASLFTELQRWRTRKKYNIIKKKGRQKPTTDFNGFLVYCRASSGISRQKNHWEQHGPCMIRAMTTIH